MAERKILSLHRKKRRKENTGLSYKEGEEGESGKGPVMTGGETIASGIGGVMLWLLTSTEWGGEGTKLPFGGGGKGGERRASYFGEQEKRSFQTKESRRLCS